MYLFGSAIAQPGPLSAFENRRAELGRPCWCSPRGGEERSGREKVGMGKKAGGTRRLEERDLGGDG